MSDLSNNIDARVSAEKLFSDTGCISTDILLKSSKGDLTAKEQLEVEKHLIDCDLCSDAIAGFSLIKDNENTKGIIDNINEDIRTITNIKQKKVFVIGYPQLIAASIAMLILFSIILYFNLDVTDNNQGVIADNISTQKTTPNTYTKEPVTSSITKTDVPAIDKTQDASIEAEPDIPITIEEPAAEKLITASGANFNKTAVEKDIESENGLEIEYTIKNGRYVVEDEVTSIKRAKPRKKTEQKRETADYYEKARKSEIDAAVPQLNEAVTEEIAEPVNIKGSRDLYSEGIRNYNSGNYQEAIKIFKKLLSADPNNIGALYHNGVSYYKVGKTAKAIVLLEKVTNKKTGNYFESARWYKAQAYLKKGRKDEGIQLLKEIASVKGPYNSKAKELLKSFE